MAAWAYLNHDVCKLPTLAEIEKVNAKTGSVVKCGDSATGCGRLWGLSLEDGKEKWTEVSPVQHEPSWCATERPPVPVSGSDYASRLEREEYEREKEERRQAMEQARAKQWEEDRRQREQRGY